MLSIISYICVGLVAASPLVAIYVTVVRPAMAKTPGGKAFLDYIEPIERALYLKSETLFWNRFKFLLGTILTILTTTDLAPFMAFIPEKYKPIAVALPTIALALDGVIGEWLRRDTTKPLEVVAMRADAPEEVKTAAADAEAVTKEAVAQIKQAGAL